MPKVVRFDSPRVALLAEQERLPLGEGQVRVRTLYSGISAGTELTAYRGQSPYLNASWDAERRLFVPGGTSIAFPLDGWGYEEVGVVTELGPGSSGPAIGDVVWGVWGHCGEAVLAADHAAARVLPPGADPMLGVFSQIGAIALNVVLDADIHVTETVAVFGLGVPGQLAAQLARLNGARVIAVDRDPRRLEIAKTLGADETIDATEGEVGERIRALTGGRGADVCLEVSGAYPALHEAIRSVAYSSRVVAAGFFQGEGHGLRLGEEAHHNRTAVIVSQIGGVAPHLQHRWDTYRLQSSFMNLAMTGRLHLHELISHVIAVADVARAFTMLDTAPGEALQVVLEFDQ